MNDNDDKTEEDVEWLFDHVKDLKKRKKWDDLDKISELLNKDENRLLLPDFCKRYGFTQREAAKALGYTYAAWRAYHRGQNTVKRHVLVGMKLFKELEECKAKLEATEKELKKLKKSSSKRSSIIKSRN